MTARPACTTTGRLHAPARTPRLPRLPHRHGQGPVHRQSGHCRRGPEGRLLLTTVRSHDQFNTTVYGYDDRYRGIKGGRRVVFLNDHDLRHLGLTDGDMVDLVSDYPDGERRAAGFRVTRYPTPRGCAATYFPEANVLVPLDSTAETSNTPNSKSVLIRIESAHAPAR